jgi:hypothetical protein
LVLSCSCSRCLHRVLPRTRGGSRHCSYSGWILCDGSCCWIPCRGGVSLLRGILLLMLWVLLLFSIRAQLAPTARAWIWVTHVQHKSI